jgi:hypothetical protein
MAKDIPKPKLTVFMIPGPDSEQDKGLEQTDRTMIVPFVFVDKLIKDSKQNKKFCYFDIQNKKWHVCDNKDVPFDIDKELIIEAEAGEIISHQYFVTV